MASILARAFAQDPFFDWLVARDQVRDVRRRNFFKGLLDVMARTQGEIWTDDAHRCAAVWFRPGQWRAGPITQLWMLPYFLRSTGLRSSWKKFLGLNSLESRHPKQPHCYLLTIGVRPPYQGRGYGRALLEPLLQSCDSEGVPAYLETATEINIRIYARYGFTVMDQFNLPFDGPKIWTMWRE